MPPRKKATATEEPKPTTTKKRAAVNKKQVPDNVDSDTVENTMPSIQMQAPANDKDNDGDCNQEGTHIILQLPIGDARMETLLQENMQNMYQYNPNIEDPIPYVPTNQFASINDELQSTNEDDANNEKAGPAVTIVPPPPIPTLASTPSNAQIKKCATCFWCCHEVGHHSFGMPIRYDAVSNNFTLYGVFCSLECTSAYNFSVHLGSDRAWEIQSWIQMLAKRFGYLDPVRPAPSKYLLKMFDGPLTIEEFRNAHKHTSKTYVLNVPPLVSIAGHMDVINTSFMTGQSTSGPNPNTGGSVQTSKPIRKSANAEKKKTIDAKMNLIIEGATA